MEALHCSQCGTLVANVSDRRFGLVPTSVKCVYCSAPAFRRPTRVVAH